MRLRFALSKLVIGLPLSVWMLSCGGGGSGSGAGNAPLAAPVITSQPTSQTTILGQTATFSTVASGNPSPTYHWSRNGSPITGASAASYTTPATTKADDGTTFSVVATNSQGSITSNAVNLKVQWAPTITAHPGNQAVSEGQAATFTAVADSNPAPAFQWQKNGQSIANATQASYTTQATRLSDTNATFTVVVSNSVGSQTSNPATLTVNPLPTPPSITTQPVSATVQEGQKASFNVVGSGSTPLTYQWRKNGTPITSGGAADSYSITSAQNSDAGTYDVIVNNLTNQPVTSDAATLTVTPVPQAPSITTQPADVSVTEGNSATFRVLAGGTAPLSYQWQKNQVDIGGATLSTFTISAAALVDSGAKYRCRVVNAAGEVYSNEALLTVNSAPHAPVITSFTANPTSITLGQSTTLAWAITGATNLYFLETGLGNVTGLTSKQVTPANSGTYSYTLVAENAVGITSAAVEVKVNPVPTFPLTVNLGTGVTGAPSASNTYAQGTVVSYSYSLQAGYTNLQVTLDGNSVAASGSVTMDAAHSISVAATPLPPTISGFSPTQGQVGSPVVVTGTNFFGLSTVTLGGVAAAYVANSTTQITLTVPSGITGGKVSVTTQGGTATSTTSYTVVDPPPVISGYSPSSGPLCTQVTISGSYFSKASSVEFNGTSAKFSTVGPNTILATVPFSATSGPISVTTPTGSVASSGSFVVAPPAITSFSPQAAKVGSSVVITGTYLTNTLSVTFNGVLANFVVNNDNQVTAMVPVGATSGFLRVSVGCGQMNTWATSTSSFVVTDPVVVSSFSPSSGSVGEWVTIKGMYFTGTSSVAFNGTNATFFVIDDSTIHARVLVGSSTGRISVTTPSFSAFSSTNFVVTIPPPPTITSISPSSGKVGTRVLISGTNLVAATSVYVGPSPAYFEVYADGTIAATVPAGATSGPVEVITTGGNVFGPTFTVLP